ncbi:MAG: pyrimidine dimer DNA glycosylase/endonuclease V [Asticcacaulis sp.]
MTRINCVPVTELSGPHLVAEYRELPRIFALVRAASERGETPDDPRNPRTYVLGKGHVRFFYPRLGYLATRQAQLIAEMLNRGYKPSFTDPSELLTGIDASWCNDWLPDDQALSLNRARIAERTPAKSDSAKA